MDLSSETVKTLIGHGRAMSQPIDLPGGGVAFLAPNDYQVHTHKEAVLPDYIQAEASFTSPESFSDYTNTFKTGKTRICGNLKSNVFRAYFDYHLPGEPSWNKHFAQLTLQHSPQWEAWGVCNNALMNQGDFAEFIEDNRQDVIEPDGATLLEIITDLESKTEAKFQSSIRRSDGSMVLNYEEETKTQTAKGNIPLPTELELGVPIFRHGEIFKIKVFLRARVRDGNAKFVVKIDQMRQAKESAFLAISQQIHDATGLFIWEGSL